MFQVINGAALLHSFQVWRLKHWWQYTDTVHQLVDGLCQHLVQDFFHPQLGLAEWSSPATLVKQRITGSIATKAWEKWARNPSVHQPQWKKGHLRALEPISGFLWRCTSKCTASSHHRWGFFPWPRPLGLSASDSRGRGLFFLDSLELLEIPRNEERWVLNDPDGISMM